MDERKQSFIDKAAREKSAMSFFIQNKPGVICSETIFEYESFDFHIASGVTEFLAEVKVRTDYTLEQIQGYGGSFLEFKKVEGIRQYKETKESDSPVLYFNFYKDCLAIYQIPTDPTMYTWELKWLQKDDYDKRKIWKWVTKLNNDYNIETIRYDSFR